MERGGGCISHTRCNLYRISTSVLAELMMYCWHCLYIILFITYLTNTEKKIIGFEKRAEQIHSVNRPSDYRMLVIPEFGCKWKKAASLVATVDHHCRVRIPSQARRVIPQLAFDLLMLYLVCNVHNVTSMYSFALLISCKRSAKFKFPICEHSIIIFIFDLMFLPLFWYWTFCTSDLEVVPILTTGFGRSEHWFLMHSKCAIPTRDGLRFSCRCIAGFVIGH